jgi:hypothetical protein
MRRSFLQVQGMNCGLMSAEWENIDLLIRLQLAAGLRREQFGSARVASSIPAPRGAEALHYNAANHALGSERSKNRYWLGQFSGTLAEDLRRWGGSAELLRWVPGRGWVSTPLRGPFDAGGMRQMRDAVHRTRASFRTPPVQ